MDPVTLIAVLVAAGAVGGLVAAVGLILRRRSPATARPSGPGPVPQPAGEPQVYIVLDVDSIFDLYDQTPGAAVLQRGKSSRSTAVEVGVDGAPVTVGVKRALDGEIETEYLPVTYATRAVSIVERHLQLAGRITSFDLKAPTDDSPLVNLLKSLHTGAETIGLTVPADVEAGLRAAWKQRSRLVGIATLESLGPFVRLRAEFAVAAGPAAGEWVLEHSWDDPTGPIRVQVVCPRGHVRPSFPSGLDRITATCLGMPNWDSDNRLLELQPLSICRS